MAEYETHTESVLPLLCRDKPVNDRPMYNEAAL